MIGRTINLPVNSKISIGCFGILWQVVNVNLYTSIFILPNDPHSAPNKVTIYNSGPSCPCIKPGNSCNLLVRAESIDLFWSIMDIW